MRKWIFSSVFFLVVAESPLAGATAPVVLSEPSPAISDQYAVGDVATVIYTITNNISGQSFPIVVSGISGAVSRTTVDNDCGDNLRAGPASCQLGITIAPLVENADSVIHQRMQIDYQGRSPLTSDIRFTVPAVPSNKIIFATATSYTGNLNSVDGADTRCQAAADSANLSGLYKAVLLASTRYPCDATGCGSSHSHDWPVSPSTPYVTTTGSDFMTSDSHGIFATNFTQGTLLTESGSASNGYFWMGINYITTGLTTGFTSPLVAWYYTAPTGATANTAHNCSDWQDDAHANAGWVGDSSSNTYTTDGTTVSTSYYTADAYQLGPMGSGLSRWDTGLSPDCATSMPIVCVQQ